MSEDVCDRANRNWRNGVPGPSIQLIEDRFSKYTLALEAAMECHQFALRLVVAALAGTLIGLERESREKAAGFR